MKCSKLATLVLTTFLLASCDMAGAVKDGMAMSERAAGQIFRQCGTKPQVGFNYYNNNLGSVTVQFPAVPRMSVTELEKVSRKAVRESFKAEPEILVVSFEFRKAG